MAKERVKPLPVISPRPLTVLLALEWWHDGLYRGIGDYARRRGWSLLDLRHYKMKLPRSFRPEGILMSLSGGKRILKGQLLALGVPVLQIDDLTNPRGRPCVLRDGAAAGRMAAEHFIDKGYMNLAYLRSEVWGSLQARLQCESFVRHGRRLGAKVTAFAVQLTGRPIPWIRLDTLVARFKAGISGLDLPIGIFTYHDIMALRLCHYCDEIGLSVPEQAAVLGSEDDGQTLCECASVPLSSMDPNYYDQGLVAAELLDRIITGQDAPTEPVMIQPRGVVTRQSTDMFAVPDVAVARALRYIWSNYSQSLTVRDVAEAVGICRRKLEKHFRTYLGRSVNEEFTRKRIERCCELLTTTRKSVADIATEVGFQTGPYLFRLFRKAMDMTPRQYRLAKTPKAAGAEGGGEPLTRRRPG